MSAARPDDRSEPTEPLSHRPTSQLVLRGAAWSALVNGIAGPLNLVVAGYALAVLGAEAYGVWALIAVFGNYLRFGDMGLSGAFSRQVAERLTQGETKSLGRSLSSVTTLVLLSGTLLCGGAYLLRKPILFHLFRLPLHYRVEAQTAFSLMLAATLAALLSPMFSSLLTGAQRTDIAQKIGGAVKILMALAMAGSLGLGYGIVGLAVVQLAFNVLGLLAYVAAARHLLPQVPLQPFGGVHLVEAWRLLRFGGGLQLLQVAIPVLTQVDRLFIAHYLSVALAGKYDLAARALYAVTGWLYQLPAPLFPAAAAMMAETQQEQMRRWIARSVRLFGALAVPIFGLLCAGAPVIVQAWIGRPEPAIAWALSLLSAVQALNCVTVPGYYMLLGSGRLRPVLTAALACAVLDVALAWSGVLLFGYWGVVTANGLAYVFLILWLALCIQRALGLTVWEHLRAVPLPFVIGAAEGLTVGLLAPHLVFSRLVTILLIGAMIPPGLLLLWATPYLEPEDRRSVYRLLRWQWLRNLAVRLSPVGRGA